MTVLEMLAEVVGAEELLARVALSELVDILKVTDSLFPVLLAGKAACLLTTRCRRSRPDKLIAAVATCVGLAWTARTLMESPLVTGERRA
jgi:hypothetical protein